MLYGKRDENGLWIRQYFDQTPVAIRDTRRLSDGSLGIKWETRRKAEGYEIFRNEAGGSWKRIKTVGKVNSYRDKTCRPGTRYYYRVRAYAMVRPEKLFIMKEKVRTSACFTSAPAICKGRGCGKGTGAYFLDQTIGCDRLHGLPPGRGNLQMDTYLCGRRRPFLLCG